MAFRYLNGVKLCVVNGEVDAYNRITPKGCRNRIAVGACCSKRFARRRGIGIAFANSKCIISILINCKMKSYNRIASNGCNI